jgi:hypothetical protein
MAPELHDVSKAVGRFERSIIRPVGAQGIAPCSTEDTACRSGARAARQLYSHHSVAETQGSEPESQIERIRTMKVKASAIVACASALIALASALLAIPAVAQAPATSIKNQVVGDWQLVSIGIAEMQPYGKNPKGMMYVGADGRFSVIVISEGNAKKISFFGTYTVDDADSSMTLHVLGTTAANAGGRDQRRLLSFNGDEMTQNTASPGGRRGVVSVVWKRAS